jgi:hypothetical protein
MPKDCERRTTYFAVPDPKPAKVVIPKYAQEPTWIER